VGDLKDRPYYFWIKNIVLVYFFNYNHPGVDLAAMENLQDSPNERVLRPEFFKCAVADLLPRGGQSNSPDVSPIANTIEKIAQLPPVTIIYRDKDILCDSIDQFIQKVRRAKVDIYVSKKDGMTHSNYFKFFVSCLESQDVKLRVNRIFEKSRAERIKKLSPLVLKGNSHIINVINKFLLIYFIIDNYVKDLKERLKTNWNNTIEKIASDYPLIFLLVLSSPVWLFAISVYIYATLSSDKKIPLDPCRQECFDSWPNMFYSESFFENRKLAELMTIGRKRCLENCWRKPTMGGC